MKRYFTTFYATLGLLYVIGIVLYISRSVVRLVLKSSSKEVKLKYVKSQMSIFGGAAVMLISAVAMRAVRNDHRWRMSMACRDRYSISRLPNLIRQWKSVQRLILALIGLMRSLLLRRRSPLSIISPHALCVYDTEDLHCKPLMQISLSFIL